MKIKTKLKIGDKFWVKIEGKEDKGPFEVKFIVITDFFRGLSNIEYQAKKSGTYNQDFCFKVDKETKKMNEYNTKYKIHDEFWGAQRIKLRTEITHPHDDPQKYEYEVTGPHKIGMIFIKQYSPQYKPTFHYLPDLSYGSYIEDVCYSSAEEAWKDVNEHNSKVKEFNNE